MNPAAFAARKCKWKLFSLVAAAVALMLPLLHGLT
jgi:hypothetical protein